MSVSLWPHGRTMGFSRQEYKSGLPYPSPGDLPNPGIEPRSPALQADALPSELPGKPIVSSYSPPSLLSWLCCSAHCGKSWPEWTTHLPSLVSGNHGGWKTPGWHGVGSERSGYFLQSSLLRHSIQDGSCVLPWLQPWLRAFSHFQPHWALLTVFSTSP